jgi:uncharacterized membrane protein
MRKIINYFLQGLLYIAPLGITAYIIYFLFNFLNNNLAGKLEKFFETNIPGFGFIIIFLFLVLIGLIGQSIIARPIKILFYRIIDKAPLLKLIFSALNDLFSAFVGKEKKFNRPVIVLVNPISNLEKLGFLTDDDLSKLDEREKVSVYFPHSYNFSGELFIVPKNQVRIIDVNPTLVMKYIISGGISGFYEEIEGVKDSNIGF